MNKTPIIVIIAALFFSGIANAESNTYVIKKGDTLYGLCKRYDVSIDELKSINNITDPSRIYPGMEIKIPGGGEYKVERGDSFYGIARKFDLSPSELAAMNDMKLTDLIYPGQILSVPSDTAQAETEEDDGAAEEIAEAEKTETEKQGSGTADAGSEIVEVGYTQPPAGNFWPHGGSRTLLTGKLKGMQIDGSAGDKVFAVSGGTVVWAAEYGIYKQLVLVEGRNGIMYGYGGNEKTIVSVGDSVKAGSALGVLGGTAGASRAYFFVYKDGKPLDPEKAPRV